jgi:Holliday junction DNA helicase RuvA
MIVFLEGILQQVSPLHCVINVHGVGYKVHVPLNVYEKLPKLGQGIQLYIHPIYRAESQDLYGFLDPEDRQLFQLLIAKVSGVGAKLAISILSRLERNVLRQAIAQRNTSLLSQIPGIGKKTAERIVIELSDATKKLSPQISGQEPSSFSSPVQDAITALMTLGYKTQEAEKTILKASQLIGEQASTEVLLRHALRNT